MRTGGDRRGVQGTSHFFGAVAFNRLLMMKIAPLVCGLMFSGFGASPESLGLHVALALDDGAVGTFEAREADPRSPTECAPGDEPCSRDQHFREVVTVISASRALVASNYGRHC